MSRAAPDSARSVKPARADRSPQLVALNLLPELDLTDARTSLPLQLEITVRYSTGAYNTNQVFGFRSSSTSSAWEAAKLQSRKVFGEWGPTLLHNLDAPADVYKGSGNLPIAWCWASGLVEFGHVLPDDAQPIATGPEFNLLKELGAACRHGKGASAGSLLVPGIPEAPNEQEGLRALRAFIQWRAHSGNNAAKALRRLGITYAAYPGSAA
jgi:hypothetical protein